MLNKIWLGLIIAAVTWGALTGRLPQVTDGALEGAKSAVDIIISITGMMAMWMGIMRIAEKSGLMKEIGRAIRPVVKRIFPDVPQDHPAMGAIVMNIAANVLGLGNAATPLGIKAMHELQELNHKKDMVSNAQAVFIAINTASVTLIPATVIALRSAAGSSAPQEIIAPAIIVSSITTFVAIFMSRLLQSRGDI